MEESSSTKSVQNEASPQDESAITLPRGLHNQGATCYLNCLMQALFMTPEIRNGIYRCAWSSKHLVKRLDYQLQKLFLALQTAEKAVHTYGLTLCLESAEGATAHSNANDQKDIQEFWHEIVDALQTDLQETDQRNLIKDLYMGEMEDYVLCTKCGHKDSRSLEFLDIPLAFEASESTFSTVEDGLYYFLCPSPLEETESNQSFCNGVCKRKCNALKGFNITRIPPVLTLHLMRFSIDPKTNQRVKLDDRMEFPDILDVSPYIFHAEEQTATEQRQDDQVYEMGTVDDSGQELELRHHPQNVQKNMPYELFAILVHAGSCTSGHYYAYIKSMQDNKWFCFDDRRVFKIPLETISGAYGGKGSSPWSGNAYTLMYRSMDDKREKAFMSEKTFPPHLAEHLALVKNPWTVNKRAIFIKNEVGPADDTEMQENVDENSRQRWLEKEKIKEDSILHCQHVDKSNVG